MPIDPTLGPCDQPGWPQDYIPTPVEWMTVLANKADAGTSGSYVDQTAAIATLNAQVATINDPNVGILAAANTVTAALGTKEAGDVQTLAGEITAINDPTAGIAAVAAANLAGLASRVNVIVYAAAYGAVGDNSTDDTAAITRALAAVPYGGIVMLSGGHTYKITYLTIPAGVRLIGHSMQATTLITDVATGNVITMGSSSTLDNMQIASSVTRTAGSHVLLNGNGIRLHDVELTGYYIGVTAGVAGTVEATDCILDDLLLGSPCVASGGGGIDAPFYSNLSIRNACMVGPVSGSVQPDFGVRLRNGDTCFLSQCNITLHGAALLIQPPVNNNVYATNSVACYYDSSGTISSGSPVSSCEVIPAGGAWDTLFTNCWFGISTGASGCYLGGTGTVDGVTFTGCEFVSNGDCGLIAVGSNVINWIVVGGYSAGNKNCGVRAASGTSGFSITGHRAGAAGGRGVNNYGIVVDAAASTNYSIVGNYVGGGGNTTANISDSGTGYGYVANNIGYNGITAAAALAVGASPWSYTSGHTQEAIYISNGTVSEVAIDAAYLFTTTNVSVTLSPHETMQITYSAAPTVIRKAM